MTTEEKPTPAETAARGRQFPALSLPDSAKIIKKAGAYGRDLSIDALATYAGHSTSNSGPFRSKLASLKDWGLISGPNKDGISLTDRAMEIALPQSEETEVRAMKEAFLGFGLFSKMYTSSAKGVELSLTNLANTAVHTLKITVKSKDKFVRSFIASAVSVGLAELSGRDKVVLQPQDSDDAAEELDDTAAEVSPPSQVPSIKKASSAAPVMQQTWEFENGTVTLSIDSSTALGLDVFRELPSVIESVEKLVNVLGPKKDTTESVSD